jgi:hypothetical protein
VVSFIPLPLYFRAEVPDTNWIGGCMAPEPVWTLEAKIKTSFIAPARNRTLVVETVAQSLY